VKKLLFALFTIPALLFAGCSGGGNPIDMVKTGSLQFDTSVTVGDALSGYQYFSNTSWKSYEDPQKRTIVEFNGVLDYDKFIGSKLQGMELTADMVKNGKKQLGDIKLTYVAQFTISKTDETFDVQFSGLNMAGTNRQTGEAVNQNIPDSDLTSLQYIYSNQPEPSTWGLLGS